jgi:RND family efflux transporter MFP subunit
MATIAALLLTRPAADVEMRQVVVQVVEALSVSQQDIRPFESVVGRLEPVRKTAMNFEVEGIVIEQLVKPGQLVDEGQTLLVLDDADYRGRLVEAESLLEQEVATRERDRQLLVLAEKKVALANNEVERLVNLGKNAMASKSALDDARQQLAQLQSEKASLQYSIDTAGQRYRLRQSQRELAERNLQRTRLTAPYRGRVNAIYSDIGDRVTPGTRAVDFIDDAVFEISLHVSRQVVSELVEGMPIMVNVENRVLQGIVMEFQRDPDPQTFTYAARIQVAGPGLLSGTLAKVKLPLSPALDALVVPLSAVLQDDGQNSVFVINDNVLEKRPVKLGIGHNNLQVIAEGLQPGEQIVARDVASLADQQQVTIQ